MNAVLSQGGVRRKRLEWYADVIALKNQGLSGIEVARQLGLSHSFVYELLGDPDGSKLKERKKRYRGVCVDCGKETKSRQSKRCDPCQRIHVTPPHGTRNRYQAGCRCEDCMEALRAYHKSLRLTGTAPNHGTVSGYKNYGCRCEPCRKAHRDYQRRMYDERKHYPSSIARSSAALGEQP